MLLFEEAASWLDRPEPSHCPQYFSTTTPLQPLPRYFYWAIGLAPRSVYAHHVTSQALYNLPPHPDALICSHLLTSVHLLPPHSVLGLKA